MRFLLIFSLLIVALLSGAWLGGESWLAGRATTLVEQRGDVTVSQIRPLRETGRIGLRAEGLEQTGQIGGTASVVSLPWLEVWARPTSPNALHATLPELAVLTLNGDTIEANLTGAQAMVRLSPTNGATLTEADVNAERVELAGAPAIEGLDAHARLVGLGHGAPHAARAAYDVALNLDALDAGAFGVLGLPPLALPGAVSVQGELRLWLTAAIGREMLQGQGAQPQPVGFRTEGLTLGLGEMQARLIGEVSADDQGRAAGLMALYTADSQAWLQAASQAGMIPPSAVMLGGAMLRGLSEFPLEADGEAQASTTASSMRVPPVSSNIVFPLASEGEVRLPIILREGKIFLGSIPVGTAPQLIDG